MKWSGLHWTCEQLCQQFVKGLVLLGPQTGMGSACGHSVMGQAVVAFGSVAGWKEMGQILSPLQA